MEKPAVITRRSLLAAGAAVGVGCGAKTATVSEVAAAGVYERLGVRTFINAIGTLTTFSGTLMHPEVKAAMEEASQNFVRIHDLQEKAGIYGQVHKTIEGWVGREGVIRSER